MHQNLDSFQKKGAFSICFRKRGVSLRKGGGSKLFRYCSDPPAIPPLQIKHKKQHKQPHSIYNTNCPYNKFSFKRSISYAMDFQSSAFIPKIVYFSIRAGISYLGWLLLFILITVIITFQQLSECKTPYLI